MFELSKKNHPWENFINARAKALLWARDEMKCSNLEIAKQFSMDDLQVTLILQYLVAFPNEEKKDE